MEFESFEQAFKICLESEDGSERQLEAMVYCLEHAPQELRDLLRQRHQEHLAARHQHHEGCGCGKH
ncbi:MAG: hypothetical protein AB1568_02320 [Thermodesulfobacteriota bacterium]